MNQFAIEVKELTKQFDNTTVVNHISLTVKRGAIFGFLGSNGSGKTTTIRMICGLLTPTSGEGFCLGLNIRSQRDAIKQRTGYMPQKFSVYLGLTVYQNLRFIADIYQLSNSKHAINQIINELELTPYRNLKASELSGGWKQKLALSCCLLHKPQLLFLDEPTAGVDPKARKDFWDYLHRISNQYGTTILVTTHYMDEAEKCTDLAYIDLGNLLYVGATKELVNYSQIKTYIINADRTIQGELQSKLITKINQKFPKLITSIVNNDLRVASRDQQTLQDLIAAYPDCSFKPTTPNFEEVFIGLMTT